MSWYLFDAMAPGGATFADDIGLLWSAIFTAAMGMVGALLALFFVGRFTTRFLMQRDVANRVFAGTAILGTLLLIGIIVAVAVEFA